MVLSPIHVFIIQQQSPSFSPAKKKKNGKKSPNWHLRPPPTISKKNLSDNNNGQQNFLLPRCPPYINKPFAMMVVVVLSAGTTMSNLNNVAVFNTDILQLFSELSKNQYNDDKCYIFDAASVMRVLHLAKRGVGEKYQNLLSNLTPIIENGPEPLSHSASTSAVLVRKGFQFTDQYRNFFKDDPNIYSSNIPTTYNDLVRVNKFIRKNDEEKDFLSDIMNDSKLNLAIIDKSSFNGEWIDLF